MDGELDYESFAGGLLWGLALVLTLIRFEVWLRRSPPPAPPDPFETLRWEVLQAAREMTRDAT